MTQVTQSFQAETKELLDLMIHSLYSHREIFLRELISNASDAIEKLKFENLTQPELFPAPAEFEIRLSPNPEQKTLSISDNGIGMTYDEVVQNLGTIAHSGTKSFLKVRQELKDNPELIGQFGVGFYSSFMVADKVTVHTQKAGTTQGTVWESAGQGTYTLDSRPRPEGPGTTLTLHLKSAPPEDKESDEEPESQDFTNDWTLKGLVKKYSDFISYPIKMKSIRTEEKDGKEETVIEDQTLNSMKALWLRSPSEIKQDEYNEFYRHLTHDWTDPLKTIHYKAEGAMEFAALLYLPSKRPMDYEYRERKIGLSLYVKRVFIKSDCEELIPPYLRFVKGMVDSDDLSLNVSREILQQNQQVGRIKKALTSKVLGTLRDLLDKDRENYEKFWAEFGVTLKEGIAVDPSQKDKLKDLFIFRSTESDKLTTLKEYVTRMKPEQKAIYYITGDSLTQIQNSPYLEKVRAKGFEVLFMSDQIDDWVADGIGEYESKSLQSVMSEKLDISSEEEKKAEEQKIKESEEKLKPVIETMAEALKEQIKEVRISDRLTDSPACLVSADRGATAHMERILKAMGQPIPKLQRIMEINPTHPLFEKMLQAPKDLQQDWAEILYQQALLNEGSQIENPLQYSKKIAKLMMSVQLH